MDILTAITELLKFFGLKDLSNAGGWIVSVFVSGFMVWRIMVIDKKYDEFVNKMVETINTQEDEWRKMISKTDDITFEMLKSTTQTMTMMTEKINTLQMILIQLSNNKKG